MILSVKQRSGSAIKRRDVKMIDSTDKFDLINIIKITEQIFHKIMKSKNKYTFLLFLSEIFNFQTNKQFKKTIENLQCLHDILLIHPFLLFMTLILLLYYVSYSAYLLRQLQWIKELGKHLHILSRLQFAQERQSLHFGVILMCFYKKTQSPVPFKFFSIIYYLCFQQLQFVLFLFLLIQTMSALDRVDQLVKKNNQKYIQEKYQHEYQKQLQQYDKQRKKQALRSYAQIIKEGNKKAVEKSKMNKTKNKTQKAKKQQIVRKQDPEDNVQNKKNKLNQTEIKKIERAIQTRAQKLIQQKQLQKLNKCLEDEKKKTKLFELNQKCRKLVKSHVKLPTSNIIPEDRKKILQDFERQAMQEIEQLDDIIEGIIEGKKGSNKKKVKETSPYKQMPEKVDRFIEFDNQHPLFTKSTDELLSFDYIPI